MEHASQMLYIFDNKLLSSPIPIPQRKMNNSIICSMYLYKQILVH